MPASFAFLDRDAPISHGATHDRNRISLGRYGRCFGQRCPVRAQRPRFVPLWRDLSVGNHDGQRHWLLHHRRARSLHLAGRSHELGNSRLYHPIPHDWCLRRLYHLLLIQLADPQPHPRSRMALRRRQHPPFRCVVPDRYLAGLPDRGSTERHERQLTAHSPFGLRHFVLPGARRPASICAE